MTSETLIAPSELESAESVTLAHGAGGEDTRRLIEEVFRPAFSNSALDALGDAAIVRCAGRRLAFTTDSFVVRPLEFPGGSIGELAVNGTVNDLAVSGARPLAISASFILEAGLSMEVLRREVQAMRRASVAAGVRVVTGDTKVVEHGAADGMYITTSGIGLVDERAELGAGNVRMGDRVLLSGPIGAHGVTILAARSELELEGELRSDTRPLTALTLALLDAAGGGVRWMRDATRGGVATVLNELAASAGCGVLLRDAAIPVLDVVRGACELLGLDPLHIANEGQFVAIVAADYAERALAALRRAAGGEAAVEIGEIVEDRYSRVLSRTAYGGTRRVDVLSGDPLPRIC